MTRNDTSTNTQVKLTSNALSKAQLRLQQHPGYYWFIVIFMVAVSMMGSCVNDMYAPALPEMCDFFGCSVSTSQMGLTMGMLGLAMGQFVLGPVSDRYGRKPVLVGSAAVFICADVACLFSPTIGVFNGLRLLQGMGASGAYFLGRTVPADIYSGASLAKIMAVIGAINGVAPASAPVVGGMLAQSFGWRSIFIALAVYAVVILALSPMLKESLTPARRAKGAWWHDFSGYKQLIFNRAFMVHVALKGTSLGLLFAYISATPFIFQKVYGFTQTQYGLIIGFNALFMAAGAMLAIKFKPLKRAAVVGSLITLAGTAALCWLMWTRHSFISLEIVMIIICFALGLIFTTANTLAMNEGRERAGEASALLGISGYMVGAAVSPLVGLGNVMHSSAVTFAVLAVLVVVLAYASGRLHNDLQ